jgi:NfeD-like C-terminal, partner-binding
VGQPHVAGSPEGELLITGGVVRDQIWILIMMAIAVGIAIGAIVVLLIFLRRGNEHISSLRHRDRIVGKIGIVSLPFDASSRGKIRITIGNGSRIIAATTTDEHRFAIGDSVIIIEVLENHVCVTSEHSWRLFQD